MAMTNKEYDIDIDSRQFRCHLKFEKIVNQFDEVIQVVDTAIKPRKSKRRRVISSEKRSQMDGEKSGSDYGASSVVGRENSQTTQHMNGVSLNFITTHLHHLNSL